MPQSPKITKDVEIDSWSLQATQEINDLESRLAIARRAAEDLADVSDPPTQAEVQAILDILRSL